MAKYRVYIARVPSGYQDVDQIQMVIEQGLGHFPIAGKLKGHVVIKPNLVLVHKRVARNSFTRPEVVEAFLKTIESRVDRISIVENSGRGAPTRAQMRHTRFVNSSRYPQGYFTFEKLFSGKVRCRPIMEDRLAHYLLTEDSAVDLVLQANPEEKPNGRRFFWNCIETTIAYAEADFVVYMPKLKSNVLSHGLTGALKLGGIGNLTDRNRMVGHNLLNDVRIVDMLEVVVPDLIITDAIRAAVGGNQMTQGGKELGALLIADNPVAHDVVAAHLLHLDPYQIDHLRLAHERGYGPMDISEIEINGDFPISEIREKTRYWDLGFIRVDRFGEKVKRTTGIDFPIEIISGQPYQIAGIHGVLLDWLYMVYDDPKAWNQIAHWPRSSMIIGETKKLPAYSTVYLIGDRAYRTWQAVVEKSFAISIPERFRSFIGLPRRIERYRRKDGKRGWAIYIPGDPQAHKDMICTFALCSGMRMRASLFRFQPIFDTYISSVKEFVIGWWKNRKGIPEIPVSVVQQKVRQRETLPG